METDDQGKQQAAYCTIGLENKPKPKVYQSTSRMNFMNRFLLRMPNGQIYLLQVSSPQFSASLPLSSFLSVLLLLFPAML